MKTTKILPAVVIILITLFDYVLAQSPNVVHSSESAVFRFVDGSEIADSYSQLIRTNSGIAIELTTVELESKAPYTSWWVIFNTPEGCSEACGEDDIFDPDGNMSLNSEANISILFADGVMSDTEGNANFNAVLHEGRTLGQVLVGSGLTSAKKAEVHLVVRFHGDFDTTLAYEQLSTFQADCVDCVDVQFTIHQPKEIAARN